MITKNKGKYYVKSESKGKDGKRKNLGGPYPSKFEAQRRLRQVEYFKNKK